jgi:hypothetical protein
MAAPANPTASELVTEALAKAGDSAPDSALKTRAETKWLEEIKNDIWKRSKKLKSLQITTIGIIPKGQSRFSNPNDYSSDLTIAILDGNNSGTAQAGSTATVTLAATDKIDEGVILGKDILITSGTGIASMSQVTAYNATTKVARVTPAFKAAPAAGSVYLVIDREYPVEQRPIGQYSLFQDTSLIRPRYYFPIGDEDFGEFIFNSPPDKKYGSRLRYYANVMKIDLSSTHMSTLYLQWRGVFLEGLMWKRFVDVDDTRQNDAWVRYQRELNTLIMRETYGTDLSGLVDNVKDFF